MADKTYNGAFTGLQIDEAVRKVINNLLMEASIYDPQGKAQDIFQYVDDNKTSGVHIGPDAPTDANANFWVDTDDTSAPIKYKNPDTDEWEAIEISTGDGTTESITYPGCFYRMVNGVQEWLNPPMELGVEYKTTERYLGKPVYAKIVDCGLITGTQMVVDAGLPSGKTIVDFCVIAKNGEYAKILPYHLANGTLAASAGIVNSNIQLDIFADAIKDRYSATAIIKYTKTTD